MEIFISVSVLYMLVPGSGGFCATLCAVSSVVLSVLQFQSDQGEYMQKKNGFNPSTCVF